VGNVIEINGKKYDAATGKLIHSETSAAPAKQQTAAKTASVAKARPRSGVSVDGMMGGRRPAHAAPAKAAKPLQKSQTLMRSAVKKPVPITKPVQTISVTRQQLGQSKKREQTAAQVQQSPLVSHFGGHNAVRSTVVKKVGHLPVKQPIEITPKPAPRHAPPSITHAAAKVGKAASHGSVEKKNLVAAKMIETALASATAHEQQVPSRHQFKRRHRLARRLGISARAIAISTTVLAGVLLGGFFAIQNVPNLSMRVAATQAGFNATMPGYNPSGFSFKGPINYSPGQVTVSFKSHSDDRSYELTQRASNWNSEALLANFVLENKQPYQAYEDKGRTLFIYGKSNATWVDNGIWYQIEGTSQLSTDQLIRIAASM